MTGALESEDKRLAALQGVRLAQLHAMTLEESEALFEAIQTDRRLPKAGYHFETHSVEFGAGSKEEFLDPFATHVIREDLTYFTYIRKSDHAKMWLLIAMDNGNVCQYNESSKSY